MYALARTARLGVERLAGMAVGSMALVARWAECCGVKCWTLWLADGLSITRGGRTLCMALCLLALHGTVADVLMSQSIDVIGSRGRRQARRLA